MAQSTQRTSKGSFPFSSVVTLASWRLRRTWFLLCVTTLGMVIAVIITCTVPLFITVTTTAGLRNTLRTQPTNSEIRLEVRTLGASTRLVQNVQSQFDPLFQQNIGSFLKQPPQLVLDTGDFTFAASSPKTRTSLLGIYATSLQQAAPHLTLVQGRLPRQTSDAQQMEVMLTPDTAQALGVSIGSIVPLNLNYFPSVPTADASQAEYLKTAKLASAHARVVGLFTIAENNLSYWHELDFTPTQSNDSAGSKVALYSLLTSDTSLLKFFDSVAMQQHIDTPIVRGVGLTWYYSLEPTHISILQLDGLITHIANVKNTIDTRYSQLEGYGGYSPDVGLNYPYLVGVNPFSPLFSTNQVPSSLEAFRSRIVVTRIPATVIALQILMLVLFFVSLMTDLLVDRQADAIAVLRSRGASRGQVFGALMTQSVGLGMLALVLGLPLTLVVLLLVSQRVLPFQVQDALNAVTNNPLQALQSVMGYAVAVVLVILLTMSFSLICVVRMDVLSTRRETARTTRRPLWQRLHLDIAAGVIALLGYGVTLYLTTIGSLLNGQIKAISSALFSLLSPYLLIVVLLLLFLRCFPLLLRLGAWFTERGRSAASMLALAQMARSPRQSIRMTTLLALTIPFALFSLVFFASQEQRINDLATYQTGADFSGTLPENTASFTVQQQEARYAAIKGVTSVSAGYLGTATPSDNNIALTLQLRAVDSRTYARTALWPAQASAQSLSTLVAQLSAKRLYGINHNIVPVIVDATTRDKLSLHPGSVFLVSVDGLTLASDLHCLVVAIVEHIPTTGDNSLTANSALEAPKGGMLFDYQTYNTIYTQQVPSATKGSTLVPINWILLRTRDDAGSVNRVRAALTSLELSLVNPGDRRALLDTLHVDPLTLTLEGILSIGTVATLLLAILGVLLASWSSARTRLTNFAVLRALGTSPRQVATVLTWEQGLIYSIGILLGIAFGVLLATTVVPTLIYYGLSVQISLPVQIIVPLSLVFLLSAIIAVFVLALGMMVRTVAQPSLSQTLRLNED